MAGTTVYFFGAPIGAGGGGGGTGTVTWAADTATPGSGTLTIAGALTVGDLNVTGNSMFFPGTFIVDSNNTGGTVSLQRFDALTNDNARIVLADGSLLINFQPQAGGGHHILLDDSGIDFRISENPDQLAPNFVWEANPGGGAHTTKMTLTEDGLLTVVGTVVGGALQTAGRVTAAAYVSPPVAIAASNIDWSLTTVHTKTLAANTTFTFSNAVEGQAIMVKLTNTASNFTVTWPTIQWPGGVAPTMTIGAKTDIYTIVLIGGIYFGSFTQNHF